ncbi:MAG: hypothetical protein ACRDYA_03780 [Egibacteraceae bacterium]
MTECPHQPFPPTAPTSPTLYGIWDEEAELMARVAVAVAARIHEEVRWRA